MRTAISNYDGVVKMKLDTKKWVAKVNFKKDADVEKFLKNFNDSTRFTASAVKPKE
ncbi:MAG: hypothetical protein QGF00_06570 [Planctomycetota bacterium]|nr:hypothetical protein [Planctomycetota bacterium]MDP7249246.1 hypothetical protein [Planctomycetota bacterium]